MLSCSTNIVLDFAAGSNSVASGDSPYESDELQVASTPGLKDLLLTQAWGVFAPSGHVFTGAESYSFCQYCAALFLGCSTLYLPYGIEAPTPTSCTESYLAQSGSVALTTTSGGKASGAYGAILTQVTFHQWNFQTDTPISGGKCITLPSHSFNLSWP
jgi:hypothetical protein